MAAEASRNGLATSMRGKSQTIHRERCWSELLGRWLRHSDVRQVSDLPFASLTLIRSLTLKRSETENLEEDPCRQVEDSPQISVAKP